MEDPATTSISVRFGELDPYGHVNHAVYLTYFEHARVTMLDAVGFGLNRLADLGFHLVVVDVQVRFRSPAYGGDRLHVVSGVADLRPASSRWTQQLLRGDELLATNDVRAAITDAEGRPTRAPQGLVDALAPYAVPSPRGER